MLKIEPIDGKEHFSPAKSYMGDAGWDVKSVEAKVLQPGETYRFKLGFKIIGEVGKVYMVEDRSSLAMKGLMVIGRIIDNGYRGEVSVILHNSNSAGEISINKGDKIGQILVMNVDDNNYLLNNNKVEFPDLPMREDKGTGSSGN